MSVVDQRQLGDADGGNGRGAAIAIVGNAELRRQIVAALAEREPRPLVEVEGPAVIGELGMDESTIVVLGCDLDVPREIACLRRLCRDARESAIVVISPPATGAGVRRALEAGADALVFEPELELTLAATIRAVASGQSVVPGKFRASVERPILSHRERQVLALVRQGLTNAEIAKRLYLAESTIKSHLGSVFSKFGVHSRKEATAVLADLERAP
jgi:DNA-binding NarL/FixJ family response regulator